MDSFNIQNYFKRGKTVVLTLRHGDDDGMRNWSDQETIDLIRQMRALLPEFQNQRRRKKDVWVDVAKELQSKGMAWTAEDCRKKWSNMIRTFRVLEEQKQDPTSKAKRIKWPFYDEMYDALLMPGSDSLPESVTVVRLLKEGLKSVNGMYGRKENQNVMMMKAEAFAPGNVDAPLHPSLKDSQHEQTLLHLGHGDGDVMDLGVQGTGGEMQGTDLENNLLFVEEPLRFTPQPPVASTTSPKAKKPLKLAVRPKKLRPSQRKMGKFGKKSEDSVDSSLATFMEETRKQNELMLEKLTSFHENAVGLMQERNELLREIRDSLQDPRNSGQGLEGHHQSIGERTEHQETETLTLHMGPAYSTATSSSASDLSSTLVISDAATASALSGFQLVDDGTVMASLQGHEGKTVLANLGSFADSGLGEGGYLHPTLVSVVENVTSSQ